MKCMYMIVSMGWYVICTVYVPELVLCLSAPESMGGRWFGLG